MFKLMDKKIITILCSPNACIGNPKTGTFTNSEDPDEMLHNQGLNFLFKQK